MVKKTETTAVAIQASVAELDWAAIRDTYAPNASESEFAVFLNSCQANELDPRKREAYFVKYGGKPGQTITGYQSYIKKAERTGKLNGWGVILSDVGDVATVTIHRKDWDQPFVWEVDRSEFDKKQSTWTAMPRFMLKKVAIAQAFRMCFPDELGGMPYTSEELSTYADDGTSKQALAATTEAVPAPASEKKPEKAKKAPKAKPEKKELTKAKGPSITDPAPKKGEEKAPIETEPVEEVTEPEDNFPTTEGEEPEEDKIQIDLGVIEKIEAAFKPHDISREDLDVMTNGWWTDGSAKWLRGIYNLVNKGKATKAELIDKRFGVDE